MCFPALIRLRSFPDPITSVQQTRDANAVLVSSLDSTIRLMDKVNGQLLQSYKGHKNLDLRIRSSLGLADSVMVSGSEDGSIYAWDLLESEFIEKFDVHGGKIAIASAFNGTRKEWASAGADGELYPFRVIHSHDSQTSRSGVCVWGSTYSRYGIVASIIAYLEKEIFYRLQSLYLTAFWCYSWHV